MNEVSPQPRIKLSRLRDIGWQLWDPFGLLGASGRYPGKWDDAANQTFADEYDSYLISEASQLRRGTPREQVVEYLVQIETQHMAMPMGATSRKRAEAVVDAILADDTIWSCPDQHGRFG